MRRAIICGLGILCLLMGNAMAGPRDAQWKAVEKAQRGGLPKTAITELEGIYTAAMAEKAYPEAVRALCLKITLESMGNSDDRGDELLRIQKEADSAPEEVRPILQTITALWYGNYFSRFRWQIAQRTDVAGDAGTDVETWSLARLLQEIDRRYTIALADAERLQRAPIADYDILTQKGTLPDAYRPTLYDFLAHQALTFYAAGEQRVAQPEDAFEIAADSPIFAEADNFCAWQPVTTDTNAPLLKAVRIYQDLLRFHRLDADPTALANVDLERLEFGYARSVGEAKDERFGAALERLASRWADCEVLALILARQAELLKEQDRPVEAHVLAKRGAERFPKSIGAVKCRNLMKDIEMPVYAVDVEQVWTEPWPDLAIRYRNLTTIHFRAYRMEYLDAIRQPYGLGLARDQIWNRVKGPPALAWSVELPATPDYRARTHTVPAPRELKPGFYYLLAYHDPEFREERLAREPRYAAFWVSRLALVTRMGGLGRVGDEGEQAERVPLSGLVVEAESGEPVGRAEVFIRSTEHGLRETLQTDANGAFEFMALTANDPGRHRVEGGVYVHVKTAGDEIGSLEPIGVYAQPREPEETQSRTAILTDRALYRPGQIVQYKGICLRWNQEEERYETLEGRRVTVALRDPNGQEVERQTHVANAYGSFSGSMTAPRGKLTGTMTLSVVEGPEGATGVQVEEYKRPKFQVEIAAPAAAVRVNDRVTVTGKATAYTGAPIGGGKVTYRVRREVRFPIWCFWWRPGLLPREAREIAHGSGVTRDDGSFDVVFTAVPDREALEKDDPTFTYTVDADVTDANGETRSATYAVSVGYRALQAVLTAPEWLTAAEPVTLTVRTSSLDGHPMPAAGRLTVYRLKPPEAVVRRPLEERRHSRWMLDGNDSGSRETPDLSDPNAWPLGEAVREVDCATGTNGVQTLDLNLPAGALRAKFETKDAFGKEVVTWLPLTVLERDSRTFPIRIPHHLSAPKSSVEPGETFTAVWGTGYEKGRAYVEVECAGRLLQSYWTQAGRTQVEIRQPVREDMRGGFVVNVIFVRENRLYQTSFRVDVPWSNKQLTVGWERFVSKLGPGQKESWALIVRGPGGAAAIAELVATLYDASLDQYLPHHWPEGFGVFRQESSWWNGSFLNRQSDMQGEAYIVIDQREVFDARPREFIDDVRGAMVGYGGVMPRRMMGGDTRIGMAIRPPAAAGEAVAQAAMAMEASADAMAGVAGEEAEPVAPRPAAAPDLSKVSARKNLNETAFFFPQLLADAEGRVRMEFTMPEALTEWRFMAFAHDKALWAGYLEDRAVTAKDLMVEPNPPRFIREGDELEFTVKVTNRSAEPQRGRVRLALSDARTLAAADAALGNIETERDFDVPVGASKAYSWRLKAPDGIDCLIYKAVGATDKLSDGEEGYLPVLSRRILVTESLPLPIRGKQTKTFTFDKLAKSGESDTLRHQSLTVQMVSQPAWYAVMALPYLIEFPHECTEQTFNRLYANALARHIANADPKIRRVFDQWRNTSALDSPLEKNEEVKSVLLEETPWVRQAQAESQARRNVGVLFDANRLDDETQRLMARLAELQGGDGRWPWFPGGRANEYITLYIVTGFGRLRHLGADVDVAPAVRALSALDAWITEEYARIKRDGHEGENHLTPTIALYLYGRSFFLNDQPVARQHRAAVDYFLGQAREYWLKVGNRQSEGHLALALKRFGDAETAQAIARSLKERSAENEELGMFWKEDGPSWWWYRAPIETQAMMIEVFDEVAGDAEAVEACRVWLLKQKQTQDWKTSKATADAVYGLLLRGMNLLASDALVEVSLGGQAIQPENVEAGTGFYEQRFAGGEVRPEFGRITVRKVDDGVSWGAVHWQYLEDMAKVTPWEGTPLTLKKGLFVKEDTKAGPVLKPVSGTVGVGDELVTRIELRVDRDMEYVHLKDQRGSGTEPVNVLSGYRWQGGLGYYESTRDTASHFFIDYLPKGTYVFEYSTRVVHRGRYQSGMALIECMYAPEFNSHSGSVEIEVR